MELSFAHHRAASGHPRFDAGTTRAERMGRRPKQINATEESSVASLTLEPCRSAHRSRIHDLRVVSCRRRSLVLRRPRCAPSSASAVVIYLIIAIYPAIPIREVTRLYRRKA